MPTLRWVFQLLQGIHCLEVITKDQRQALIEGLMPLHQKILLLFGKLWQAYIKFLMSSTRSM
jgi:hypothetical protein